jgi:hypothetical protein
LRDVSHYTGQTLVVRAANRMNNRARELTGMPLISYNNSAKRNNDPSKVQQQQQLSFLRHQQQTFLLASYYTAAAFRQQNEMAMALAQDDDPFLPRVLKPRKRRGKATPTTPKPTQSPRAEWEMSSDEERHFLPTDLLDDTTTTPQRQRDRDETRPANRDMSPIRPPSRNNKACVRHTESINPSSASQRAVLRKTFSWTSGGEAAAPADNSGNTSLFPKSSDSDLLSSVRNGLETKTKSNNKNLEDAIKSLSIDSSASVKTRNF